MTDLKFQIRFPTVLDVIGGTPLVRLQHMNPNPLVKILVKLEYMNPSGAIKDRMVRHVIEHAERTGLLKPGGTIIEATSGNTGAAVSMIAAMKGYKAILTMPDKVSTEKQNAVRAYGAKVIVTPTNVSANSPDNYVNVAIELAKNTPNSFRLNQYDNPLNPEAHYATTGPEIWQQSGGDVDWFVASGSTGGTISGVGKYLKERNQDVKIAMGDPIGSIYYEYWKYGRVVHADGCNYKVEGIGEDQIAHAMDFSLIDEMFQFSDKDAFETARRLAREEGMLVGGSSGANVWTAMQLAKQMTEPTTIVTVLPDHGIKYLSKFHDDRWYRQNIK